MDNIEDWDFRSWRSPLREGGSSFSNPITLFLTEHLNEVIAVDFLRINVLKTMLDNGLGRLTADKFDVVLTPEGEAALPYVTSWRDRLTQDGRLHRRIVKSLVREWEKNRRLRFSVLPSDMRENFPGLFEPTTDRSEQEEHDERLERILYPDENLPPEGVDPEEWREFQRWHRARVRAKEEGKPEPPLPETLARAAARRREATDD
jgi:hypothetical protein